MRPKTSVRAQRCGQGPTERPQPLLLTAPMAAGTVNDFFSFVAFYARAALARYRKLHVFGKVPPAPPRLSACLTTPCSYSYGWSYSSISALVGTKSLLVPFFVLNLLPYSQESSSQS